MKPGAWGFLGGVIGVLVALAFALAGHFLAAR